MRFTFALSRWIVYAALFVLAFKLSEPIHLSITVAQTTLHLNALFALLLTFGVFWMLIRLNDKLRRFLQPRAPDTLKQRQQIIAHYEAAVQCVFEGRYQKSLQHAQQGEKLLDNLPNQDWTDRRTLFRLIAARATVLDRQFEQAEQLLEDPLLQRPLADVARCLMGAQVALERKQPTKALELLDYLESSQGLHRQAYQLKLRALQRAGEWSRVNQTVQTMLKRDFIEPIAALHLQRVAAAHLIRECPLQPKALLALWNNLPDTLQQHPDLLQEWLERTQSLSNFQDIAWLFKAIEETLDTQWDNTLWMAYAAHPAHSPSHALSHGERWLLKQPQNTMLLYGLGLLCTRMQLWGKAQSYLEAALSISPDKNTLHALIRLYLAEQNNEAAEALIQKTVEEELRHIQMTPAHD
jgi:HemY protein